MHTPEPQGIPARRVSLQLTKTDPSEVTPEDLKNQLNDVGLDCGFTDPKLLKRFRREVLSSFPDGQMQSYGISRFAAATADGSPAYTSEFADPTLPYAGLDEAAVADWRPTDSALGYTRKLEYIQYPAHFDYLEMYRPAFNGRTDKYPIQKKVLPTVEAIKQLFIEVGYSASSALVKGLDKTTLQALLYKAIKVPENPGDNYEENDSRVVFIVDNYDAQADSAQAIGVLSIHWSLFVKNYKEKKEEPKHDTSLQMTVRSVVYDDIDALENDVAFVKAHFKSNLFQPRFKGIKPKKQEVKIYEELPVASEAVFNTGVPVISKEDYVEVIVLFAPNIQNVGVMDNSQSDVESTYSKSVTSGFTFSMSQTIATEFNFEAGILFAKAGFKLNISVSFTEQWNNSETETFQFKVAGGKIGYTYQGYLNAIHLRYLPGSDSYKYMDKATFVTNILKTSNEPIGEALPAAREAVMHNGTAV